MKATETDHARPPRLPFYQREDVIRSRAETNAVVQKTQAAYRESKRVTTELLSLIEEYRNG